jgi:ribulose-5-phosphate 4-epimerase/fuculose-1-phosphate aldolase
MEFDLDSNPVDRQGRLMYIERFIHGEIYKARTDVNAIVHSHSPTVIPFSVTTVKLRPICHMSAFAVYRAVYTEVNARLQAQAIALGGPIKFLEPEESQLITGRKDTNFQRPWAMWKSRIGA